MLEWTNARVVKWNGLLFLPTVICGESEGTNISSITTLHYITVFSFKKNHTREATTQLPICDNFPNQIICTTMAYESFLCLYYWPRQFSGSLRSIKRLIYSYFTNRNINCVSGGSFIFHFEMNLNSGKNTNDSHAIIKEIREVLTYETTWSSPTIVRDVEVNYRLAGHTLIRWL